MIAIVTDSASMLPDDLRRRYDVSVVPLTITLDGPWPSANSVPSRVIVSGTTETS